MILMIATGFALGSLFGVMLEKHLRHRMLCRLIREQDEASMEEF